MANRRIFGWLVSSGQPAYGLAATGAGKLSSGAQALIKAADRDDPRPLWITIWGGANTLAQALLDVRTTHSPADVAKFVAKLRVYSISDQDDAGPWIRKEFPDLFYIVSPSPPNSQEYAYATWTGISGDIYYRNGEGADFYSDQRMARYQHSRQGPYGEVVSEICLHHGRRYAIISRPHRQRPCELVEPKLGRLGRTLYVSSALRRDASIWSQGGDLFPRVNSQDTVTGADGKTTLPIRRPSGAGAKPSSMISLRGWIGPSNLSPRPITIRLLS